MRREGRRVGGRERERRDLIALVEMRSRRCVAVSKSRPWICTHATQSQHLYTCMHAKQAKQRRSGRVDFFFLKNS